ncbi:hypothetical protein LTR74_015363 [Friedmanniomyces endolithicus]|nr:hypothetical protein LTR74_015363 [Friedmanniomyces endolithicus]
MPPAGTSSLCASCATALRSQAPGASRAGLRTFTTTAAHQSAPAQDQPRWKQTPPAMKMAFRLRPRPNQPEWKVNDQQAPLDEMYDSFVGQAGEAAKGQTGVESTKGRDLLPEEVKWLAITHKSFDHGRRGFNDRLAFLGKRIVYLQTSLALLRSPTAVPQVFTTRKERNNENKNVFHHPALSGTENLTSFSKAQVLSPSRLARLAQSYGVDRVVRWKPKKAENLKGSGVETVLAHTVYSIIGALAMQRGGEVAARTARERILQPLGLR